MAATAWTVFDNWMDVSRRTVDFDSDAFKMALYNSSKTFDTATDTTYTSLTTTDEVADGTGYTRPGKALTNVTWTKESAGVYVFNCDDAIWSAEGNGIVAKYAVIYNSTTDDLVAYSQLDDNDITANSGITFAVGTSAGIYDSTRS